MSAVVCCAAAPAAAQQVVFGVIGDYGSAGIAERDVANMVKGWNPAFVITVGDNNYPYGCAGTIDANIGQYYAPLIQNYKGSYGPGSATQRFYPTMGNHDWYCGGEGVWPQAYLDYFTLPGNERYYSFSKGIVDFFTIDSQEWEPDGNTATSKQARWLREQMAASPARWKMVYLHYAPYSSGTEHGSVPEVQWNYEGMGASAVFAGHDHDFERLQIGGIPYFVNGLGGASQYPLGPPLPESLVLYNANYGAQRVTVNQASVQFEFWSRFPSKIDDYTVTVPIRTLTASGSQWNAATAWSPTGVPVAGDDVVLRNDTAVTRVIAYNNPSASGTLKRMALEATGAGQMQFLQEQHDLRVTTLVVGANTRFRQTWGTFTGHNVYSAGAFQNLDGPFTVTGTFYNAGGVATLAGDMVWAPDSWLVAAGGTVQLLADAGGIEPYQLTLIARPGGRVEVEAGQRLSHMEMSGGVIEVRGVPVLLHSLDLSGDGKLDLRNGGSMVLPNDGPDDPRLGLQEDIVAGRIVTEAGRKLVFIDNDLIRQTSWMGVPIGADAEDFAQLILASPLDGDVNLDGVVSVEDLAPIAAHMGMATSSWLQGDVTGDGRVRADDFDHVKALLPPGAAATVAGVPEPAGVAGVAVLGIGLTRGRCRTRAFRKF